MSNSYKTPPAALFTRVAGFILPVYVPVVTVFDKDGLLLPLEVTREDGCTYIIDQVIDIRPSAAMKAGGQSDRYTISVKGRQIICFLKESPQLPEIISDAGLLSDDKNNNTKDLLTAL